MGREIAVTGIEAILEIAEWCTLYGHQDGEDTQPDRGMDQGIEL
jgi:hypothetical protein